ncbi:MAG: MlaD family protein [Nitrospinota bacterium]
MPRNKAYEVKVGVFVAAGLAVLALFIVTLTGLTVTVGEDEYRVRFRNVAGLENGSLVALGGLKVGRVETVGIAKDDPSAMEAVIRVKKGAPIRRDSRVDVTSVGITGSMYLSLTLGSAQAPLLKPGATLQGTEAASFQEVINEARQAAERVNKILGSLGETVDAVASDARGLMNDVRGQAGDLIQSTGRMVRRAESVLSERNERNINRILDASAKVSESLEKGFDPTLREFSQTLQKARESLAEVDKTAQAYAGLAGDVRKRIEPIEAVAREIEQFLQANRKELEATIVNISAMARRVNTILQEVAEGPDGNKLKGAAEELRLTLQKAHSLMSQLDETVASHREDIGLLITDLRDTAGNLSELSATLRERPSQVIFKPPASPREFRE